MFLRVGTSGPLFTCCQMIMEGQLDSCKPSKQCWLVALWATNQEYQYTTWLARSCLPSWEAPHPRVRVCNVYVLVHIPVLNPSLFGQPVQLYINIVFIHLLSASSSYPGPSTIVLCQAVQLTSPSCQWVQLKSVPLSSVMCSSPFYSYNQSPVLSMSESVLPS